ncbi:MAG: efflux RND transporter periplasmic adaptor subunit, partial [Akkermansia sp.]|nr:efflux RND transporter periplasmic adaptor subunit [Akkermansia sp.]
MKYHSLLAIPLLLCGAATAQMPGKMVTYVQAEKAVPGQDKIVRKSIGRTEAVRHVTIRSAVEGHMVKVHFQEGAMVRKGDLLLEIDPLRYTAAVKQAEASVAQLDAQIVYATGRYKRLATLAAQQAASREDMETAKASMEELKARRAGAEAELARARKDLEDCRILAEIDGRIGRLSKGEGNYITKGETLATIKQMDPIYVRFPLSQYDVNGIFRGPKEIGNVADVRL